MLCRAKFLQQEHSHSSTLPPQGFSPPGSVLALGYSHRKPFVQGACCQAEPLMCSMHTSVHALHVHTCTHISVHVHKCVRTHACIPTLTNVFTGAV